MRAEKKQLILAIVAIIAVMLLSVVFLISTSTTFSPKGQASAVDQTDQGEYIEINVEVSSWQHLQTLQGTMFAVFIRGKHSLPIPTPLVVKEFWTVDGSKKTSVSVTVTIEITYRNIEENSLNITICQVWFYCTQNAYLLDTSESGVNGLNTEGTVTKEYSSGTISLDGSTSDPFIICGCGKDGVQYTVYGRFRVVVEGIGIKSKSVLTADTGEKSTTPASWNVQWYGEEVTTSETTVSANVEFSSWFPIVTVSILTGFLVFLVISSIGGRKKK